MRRAPILLTLILSLNLQSCHCRKRNILLEDDRRGIVQISSFGLLKDGYQFLQLHQLVLMPNSSITSTDTTTRLIGFTVDRTTGPGRPPYAHASVDEYCALANVPRAEQHHSRLTLIFDLHNKVMRVRCSSGMENITLIRNNPDEAQSSWQSATSSTNLHRKKRSVNSWDNYQGGNFEVPAGDGDLLDPTESEYTPTFFKHSRRRVLMPHDFDSTHRSIRDKEEGMTNNMLQTAESASTVKTKISPTESPVSKSTTHTAAPRREPPASAPSAPPIAILKTHDDDACGGHMSIPLKIAVKSEGVFISAGFGVKVPSENLSGLYYVYYHNCLSESTTVNLNVSIVEANSNNNYLPAGEIPLPRLYFVSSMGFFVCGIWWMLLLCRNGGRLGVVYRFHYLLAAFVFLMSLSKVFRAIYYYYVQTTGDDPYDEALFSLGLRIVQGTKLLIIFLALCTAYLFSKHLLGVTDWLIILSVFLLEILVSIGKIILDDFEALPGHSKVWRDIFAFADILSCTALLLPAAWAKKYIDDAPESDGEVRKVKLFRSLTFILACYVYTTVVVVKLLTCQLVPFQLKWIGDLSTELATLLFVAVAGYKLRPIPSLLYMNMTDNPEKKYTALFGMFDDMERKLDKNMRRSSQALSEILLGDESDEEDEVTLVDTQRRRVSSQKLI